MERDVNTKPSIRIIAMLLALFATEAAQAQTATHKTTSPKPTGTAQVQLASILNAPLPGKAAAQGSAQTYNPDTLYQYIDGGADLYLLYDFKTLLHQDFKSGATELTADIYEMSKPEDAFGIYASERSPSYKFLAIGAEAYRDKGILNFVQDRYYVKLSGNGGNADALLDQFARLLAGRIGGVRSLPSLLAKLPHANRAIHSEQYIKKDPLGHAFLSPSYVVSYGQGKQPSKLVVSVASDAQGAKSRADQLAKHFKQSGESKTAPELGENGFRAKNSFEGTIIARTRGRYLIALFNPPENGAEILKSAAQSLP